MKSTARKGGRSRVSAYAPLIDSTSTTATVMAVT